MECHLAENPPREETQKKIKLKKNPPESTRGMMNRPCKSSCRLRCQIRRQRRYCFIIVARIVSELDCDRIRRIFRYGTIQLTDSSFGFHSLIESDESYTLGKTCRNKQKNSPLWFLFSHLNIRPTFPI